jgi:hypothetical protein
MSDVISVLGMHRNGTSSVAGTLMKIGGAPPRHLTKDDAHNERGYFESYVIVPLNDDILASAGTTWDDWREFNPKWYCSNQVGHFRRRAREAFELEFQNAPLPVVKDPRSCRFFPFWRSVYEEMGLSPRVVIPVRSPWDTARSLNSRDGMPMAKGVLLWLRHILDAEADSRDLPRSIFTWEEFLADWRGTCAKISSDTEIVWPRLSDRSGAEVDDFLSRDLRHHTSDKEAHDKLRLLNPWAFKAYEAMKELARSPQSEDAKAILTEVRDALNYNGGVFGRVLIGYELTIEESTQKLAILQQEFSAQVQAAESSAGKIDALHAALTASDQHRQHVEAELVAMRQQSELMLKEANKAGEALRQERDGFYDLLQHAEMEKAEALTELMKQREERQFREHLLEERDKTVAELRQQAQDLQHRNIDARAALAQVRKYRGNPLSGSITHASWQERRIARTLTASGLFDAAYYRGQCGNLSGAAAFTDFEATLHFIREGFSQGAKPNPLFDTRWYLEQNEDVLMSGVNPLLHYHINGWQEGRDPSPNFSTNYYLQTYPDIRLAKVDPLQHFLQRGQYEGRIGRDEDQSGDSSRG